MAVMAAMAWQASTRWCAAARSPRRTWSGCCVCSRSCRSGRSTCARCMTPGGAGTELRRRHAAPDPPPPRGPAGGGLDAARRHAVALALRRRSPRWTRCRSTGCAATSRWAARPARWRCCTASASGSSITITRAAAVGAMRSPAATWPAAHRRQSRQQRPDGDGQSPDGGGVGAGQQRDAAGHRQPGGPADGVRLLRSSARAAPPPAR